MSRTLRIPFRPVVAGLLTASVLAGCAAQTPADPTDPYQPFNRSMHAFNVGVDRVALRPVANATAPFFKSSAGTAVDNMASNLGEPGNVLNDLLQLRFHNAVHNTLRFGLNTTVGVLGAWDAAAAAGLEPRKTDFGATLQSWGAGEGDFVMLPFFGPSNERDAVGRVVDIVVDPMGHILPSPESGYATLINASSKVGDRARYGETVDSILYESADSYAQLRLIYEQSRRFELGQESGDDAFIDPYEDDAAQ